MAFYSESFRSDRVHKLSTLLLLLFRAHAAMSVSLGERKKAVATAEQAGLLELLHFAVFVLQLARFRAYSFNL